MQLLCKALSASLLVLASCGAVKSVDYYLAHRGEAQKTVAACMASAKAGRSCAQAAAALTRLTRQDFVRPRAAEAKAIRDSSDRPVLGGIH